MKLNGVLVISFVVIGVLILGACQAETLTVMTPVIEPTAHQTDEPALTPTDGSIVVIDVNLGPLPKRPGPRVVTTGTVPHVQIDVDLVPEVNEELFRLAFSLPDVENRPTIISLPGARGMWISDEVSLDHPETIVSGREFAHIHPDGSLHLSLPFERALEVAETGWGERHPWADERDGWEGFVMLYTPQTMDELEVTIQLILESYNFVTGKDVVRAEIGF